ncbi:MAG: EAL domain-containing protein [Magnetococcales bacterium]|nr:EAL domain-containing protein [Magnetococcales bacterium]
MDEDGMASDGITLLLVDDDPDIGILLGSILRKGGFDDGLTCCTEAAEAVAVALRERPHVILLDLLMPEIDGLEILTRLRREPALESVPVVILSSREDPEVKARAFAQGANDYFVKWPDRTEMLARLRYHVTAHKERLRREKAEKKFRILFDVTPDAILLADADTGVVVDCNPAACELLGASAEEIIGLHQADLHPPEDEERYRALFRSHLEQGQGIAPINVFIRRLDGRDVPVSISSVVFEMDGKRMIQGVFRDVTERIRAERAIRRSRENLMKAQEIAHLGSWEWDIGTGNLSWSDEAYRIFGYEPKSQNVTFALFVKHVHGDDRNRVLTLIRSAMKGQALYNIEHRIVRPNGTERIVHEQGEAVFDKEGMVTHLVGTVHDITERRDAEDQLRIATQVFGSAMAKVEDQFRITRKVLESAIECVAITDAKGRIQSVNPAFHQVTGYDESEVEGALPGVFQADLHEKRFIRKVRKSIAESGQWQGEVWNRRKDGEAFPEQVTVTAIQDDKGNTLNLVVLSHDISDVQRSREALRHQTYHDALTGLPNRSLFLDRLDQNLRRASRRKRRVCVILFDLDRFKNVNDSLGHAAGDDLLRLVAERVSETLREGDTVCRMGGDEFAIIPGDIHEAQDAVHVVQKLFEALEEPFTLLEHTLYITASVGITLHPEDGESAESLVRNADMAMSRAKDTGRNNFQFYTAAMDEAATDRLDLENALRMGVEKQEFALFYQPKIDAVTGAVVGMEALVRWIRDNGSPISPGVFIPMAEETGLILPLGDWILQEACRTTQMWRQKGFKSLRVAVNLSARQVANGGFFERVMEILDQTGLPTDNIELEITESAMMTDLDRAVSVLGKLADQGIHIALDDFGTGYSSLSYLKKFPIHSLKIDRSFVNDITTDTDDAAIVSAILSMARSLKLEVIAEGVENRDQFTFLSHKKCDQIQGYLFSRPLTKEAFEDFMRRPPLDVRTL